MARARLLSRTLGSSRKFAAVGNAKTIGEFTQLLYALIIPHTDDFGRLDGDAFTIKHAVFPTSSRTLEEFDTALTAMHAAGLILRYESEGMICLQVTEFERHQSNLHKRTASRFPEYPGTSGKFPELPEIPGRTELNRREENGTELNEKAAQPPARQIAVVPIGQRSHHRAHAFCGRVCVPSFLHDEFRRKLPADETTNEAELVAFYLRTEKADAGKPIAADAIVYWREKFREWQEPQAKAAKEAVEDAALIERLVNSKGKAS